MIHSDRECEEMIEDICERAADKLTEWESGFIDSLYGHKHFTSKQKEVIDRIHSRNIDG